MRKGISQFADAMYPGIPLRAMPHPPLAVVLAGVLFATLGTPPAIGQTNTPAPIAGKTGPAEEKPKRFALGVELRWRTEWRDNADLRPVNDSDGFTGQRIRINLRARLHPRFSFFMQGQDVWLFDAKSDKVIHDLNTNLHQAYFDWGLDSEARWEFRGGRQEWIYGEERLVGAFNWDNVGRSFDGARLRYRRGAWTNDFLWGRQVDVPRNGARSRAAGQDLSGAYLMRSSKGSPGKVELYALFLRDGLRTSGEIAGAPKGTMRILTLGFRRAYEPKTGWRYSVENAWQAGKRGPDGHRAVAFVATTGYAWGGRWKPRLGIEYDFATGDNASKDGRSREFNNLFPTNHPFYGYADLIGLRNMHDFRGTAAVSLHPRVQLEFDYHHFLLASPRGPWKDARGRLLGLDPAGLSGRDIGQELDFTFRLPVQQHLHLLGGYSLFLPGRFAERTRGPEPHRFAYIQTTVRF